MTEQAKTETTAATDTTGKAGAAAASGASDQTSKKDDLESILKEFEAGDTTGKTDGGEAGKTGKTDDNVVTLPADKVKRLEQFADHYERQQTRTEVNTIVSKLKEKHEPLKGLSDKMVRARLNLEAAEDPRIARAFAMRHSNPEAWDRVLGGIGERLVSEIGDRPDPKLTANREAAVAAARGRVENAPPDPNRKSPEELNAMSDAEFEAYKRNLGRRASR
jgi:hypothetical protein